jgi:hypothetical protein
MLHPHIFLVESLITQHPPNGLAQRQRRCLQGYSHYRATSGKLGLSGGLGVTKPEDEARCGRERQSRCPLEPVLGGDFAFPYDSG